MSDKFKHRQRKFPKRRHGQNDQEMQRPHSKDRFENIPEVDMWDVAEARKNKWDD